MTTEEFEKELRKLQECLKLTEEDIRSILEHHKRLKAGIDKVDWSKVD